MKTDRIKSPDQTMKIQEERRANKEGRAPRRR